MTFSAAAIKRCLHFIAEHTHFHASLFLLNMMITLMSVFFNAVHKARGLGLSLPRENRRHAAAAAAALRLTVFFAATILVPVRSGRPIHKNVTNELFPFRNITKMSCNVHSEIAYFLNLQQSRTYSLVNSKMAS